VPFGFVMRSNICNSDVLDILAAKQHNRNYYVQ